MAFLVVWLSYHIPLLSRINFIDIPLYHPISHCILFIIPLYPIIWWIFYRYSNIQYSIEIPTFHGHFMDTSWMCFMDMSWIFHGHFMDMSHGYFMDISWICLMHMSHGYVSWICLMHMSHGYVSCKFHGIFHGSFMDISWIFHRYVIDISCICHRYFMYIP